MAPVDSEYDFARAGSICNIGLIDPLRLRSMPLRFGFAFNDIQPGSGVGCPGSLRRHGHRQVFATFWGITQICRWLLINTGLLRFEGEAGSNLGKKQVSKRDELEGCIVTDLVSRAGGGDII